MTMPEITADYLRVHDYISDEQIATDIADTEREIRLWETAPFYDNDVRRLAIDKRRDFIAFLLLVRAARQRAVALTMFCPLCQIEGHTLHHHWDVVPHHASIAACLRNIEPKTYTMIRDALRMRYHVYLHFHPETDLVFCQLALQYDEIVTALRDRIRNLHRHIARTYREFL